MEEQLPLISIVVRTRNRLNDLKNCINSIRESDYHNYGIIIVNDNSTDGTNEYLMAQCGSHKDISAVNVNKTKSTAYLYNIGVKHSTGDIVAFTDDDCVVSRDWLKELALFHLNNRNIMAVGGVSYIGRTSEIYAPDRISGCNMSFKKEVFACLSFDENLKYSRFYDEADLIYKMHSKKMKTAINDKAVVYHFTKNPFDINTSLGLTLNQIYMSAKKTPILQYYLLPIAYALNLGNLRAESIFDDQVSWGFRELKNIIIRGKSALLSKLPYLLYTILLEIPIRAKLKNLREERIYKQAVPKVFLPPGPENIVLFVTSACNMRCRHCFVNKEQNNKQADISIANISMITGSLKKPANILVTGGEPFLRNDLESLLQKLMDSPKIQSVMVATNGYFPGRIKDICARLSAGYKKGLCLYISLDGLAQAHDRLRNTPGSFEKAIESCEYASHIASAYHNFHFRVNITVTEENQEEIAPLIEFLEKKGYPSIFTPVRGNAFSTFGVPYDILDVTYNPRESGGIPVRKLKNIIRIVRKRHPLYFDYKYNKLLTIMINTLKSETRQLRCYAGYKEAVIYSDGAVSLCEQVLPFGNLAQWDWNFSRAWNSGEAAAYRKKTLKCACIHGCNLSHSVDEHYSKRGIDWFLYSVRRRIAGLFKKTSKASVVIPKSLQLFR